MKQGIIFSDIDGTLCFHEEIHGIKELKRNPDGTVLVLNPKTQKKYITYDVSLRDYKAFLDRETQRLGHELQKNYDFIYVTAARPSTMYSRKNILNFVDAVILESGGMILNADYEQDEEWSNILKPEKKILEEMKEYLKSQGWILDVQGRTAAIRIRKKDNLERSQEFTELYDHLELPNELKKTINFGNLDIILKSAGKGNAVNYLMGRLGYRKSQSIGIGDDINDLDFLIKTEQKYILGSAFPEVLKIAKKERWYISKGLYFDGINEIMEDVLLKNKTKNAAKILRKE